MTRLAYVPDRIIDHNGIADGATVYVYRTETTTPILLYSDDRMTVPLANPFTVAAGAAFPAVFYDSSVEIKLRIISSTDGTITEYDPYSPLSVDVTVASSFLNIKDYGALCDTSSTGIGGTDDTVAVQATIDAAVALGGATIYVPAHTKCTGSLNLGSKNNIRIVGPSGTGAGGAAPPPAQLLYTGTGARFIDARSSFAVEVSNLGIRNTNPSFTGWLIDFDHLTGQDSAYGLITRCFIGGISGSVVGAKCINFNNSIIHRVVDNNFQNYNVGIKGGQGSYSNSITIEGNTFGAHGTAAIMNAIQMWTVQNNTFENGPRAYYDDQTGGVTNDLSWLNNWHGDGTLVGADTWISFGTTVMTGLLISGNFFDCSFTNTASIKLSQSCLAATISANSFGGGTNAGIDFGSVNHSGLVVTGNFWVVDPINLNGSSDDIVITENKKNGSNSAKHYRRLNGTQEWTVGSHNPPAFGPGIFSYNAPVATDCIHWINGDAGTYRMHIYSAAGVGRMRYGIDSSNQGAEICYDAGGGFVGYSVTTTLATMDKTFGGNINVASGKVYKVNGTQVVGPQGSAVTDAAALTSVDGTNAAAAPTQAEFNALVAEFNKLRTDLSATRTQLNTALARLRTHGLITT